MKTRLLFISATMMLSSCATMFTGTKDTIRFNSDPQGARVLIDGYDVGKTPCEARVKRSLNSKEVIYKLKGYETKTFELSTSFNAVSLLGTPLLLLYIVPGIVSFGIDLATGSIVRYDRKYYEIELEKKETVSLPK